MNSYELDDLLRGYKISKQCWNFNHKCMKCHEAINLLQPHLVIPSKSLYMCTDCLCNMLADYRNMIVAMIL